MLVVVMVIVMVDQKDMIVEIMCTDNDYARDDDEKEIDHALADTTILEAGRDELNSSLWKRLACGS